MRETWPYSAAHRFLLFDHDSKFGNDVVSFAERWEAYQCAPLSVVRGRTGLRNAGWGAADETCWIM
jgi:hypothetical protein